MITDGFIACGMYAFNDDLRDAWQQLFDRAIRLVERGYNRCDLRFETDREVLLDKRMLLGHTCGYPLVTYLSRHLTPVCVPLFDVPGCDGKLYSSVLITGAGSAITALSDCRDGIVAINTPDSNSGMNLLRHALAAAGARDTFFREVRLTGGHLESLVATAEDRVQLAAIDCVTYQLIHDQAPELVARVRQIGQTEATCGLPFVVAVSRAQADYGALWIDALEQALRELPEVASRLHLTGFSSVTRDDYQSILQLEGAAIDAGYPALK